MFVLWKGCSQRSILSLYRPKILRIKDPLNRLHYDQAAKHLKELYFSVCMFSAL